ncbi:hypothetical protein [Ahniella affigens]|uniref:hypothetical protein n=1 Tax=Ahniella affigens TaxID=2021234 RepID=UPI0011B1E453|nr:hypothetical protein [Ahniella affigens]
MNHRTILRRSQIPFRDNIIPVPEFMNRFFGGWIRTNDEVLVADAGTRQVIRMDRNGRVGAISPLTDAYFPVGLTERRDVLYVLEYPDPGNNKPLRVRRIADLRTGLGVIMGDLHVAGF